MQTLEEKIIASLRTSRNGMTVMQLAEENGASLEEAAKAVENLQAIAAVYLAFGSKTHWLLSTDYADQKRAEPSTQDFVQPCWRAPDGTVFDAREEAVAHVQAMKLDGQIEAFAAKMDYAERYMRAIRPAILAWERFKLQGAA